MSEVDAGLLVLRLFVAVLIAGHALQKSLGMFGGLGLEKTAGVFESWGFRPGRPMVMAAAAAELTGAVLVGSGLLSRVGCAILIGTLMVAAAPSAVNGLWAQRGGCEVPVLYAGMAAALAITGPGRASLDHALGTPSHAWLGPLAIVIGGLAAIPPLVNRQHALHAPSEIRSA